ncbi:MAG: hypothetical protein WDN09_02580 [bacterium]
MNNTFESGARNLLANYRKKILHYTNLKKLIMCRKCYTFYYDNSWHTDMPERLKENKQAEVEVLFTQCSGCREETEAFAQRRPRFAF